MKVLISSRSYNKNSETISYLKKQGIDVVLNPFNRKMTEEELLTYGKDVVGIIAGTENITNSFLREAKNLKVISRYGIGMDNIEKKEGILFYNTPNAPSQGVAELTLTLILCLSRKINEVEIWKPIKGNLLCEKTVGIIGMGKIGKALSDLLVPFNNKVLSYDIDQSKTTNLLDDLLRKSDVVSLHVPLNKSTYHLLGKRELGLMKETAFLINTSRGGTVDETALFHALKNRTIAGAGLDVFEDEPNVGRLKELENIVLTPHIGTYTIETRKKMEEEATKNIITGLKEVGLL